MTLILALLAGVSAVVAGSLLGFVGWGLAATLLVTLALIAFFFEFESGALGSKEIALVAMLGTLSAAVRVPFAAIPGFQPSTYLIICAGYVFGPVAGFMVGALTALISNFFLGQGPWTPYQMLAWGLLGAGAAFLRRFNLGKVPLIAVGILGGYLYGWMVNTWYWAAFIYPLTFRTFIVYQMTSIWMDTFHAAGNALFLGLFGMKTIGILERFRKRFNWRLSEDPARPVTDCGRPA
ncbi:MAG: ECF transporter S component [Dehalococcoidia bacterium]|nr:ECF transporter S component [Dehalococcoidia bacterium]